MELSTPRLGVPGLVERTWVRKTKTGPGPLAHLHYGYACVALLIMVAIFYRMGWAQGHNHATKTGWLWQIPGYEYLWAQKVINWDYSRVTESLPKIVNGASSLVSTATQAAITGEGSDLTSLLCKMALPAGVPIASLSVASLASRRYRQRAVA